VTHIFDLLNWLTDLFPQQVYTAGEGNTDNVITLNYPDHITAVIIAGDNSCAGYPKERIEINTNYKTIIGENFTETSLYTDDGEKSHKTYGYSIAGTNHNDEIRKVILKGCEWRKGVTRNEMKYGYYYDKMPKVDKGHYNEIEYFRKIIMEDLYPDTDVAKGVAANVMAWNAVRSWEKNVPVSMDFSFLKKL
jgi:predicted dehydrogenase